MKVIGAGFGRTGTDSLKEALELLLGGRCYHMKEVIDAPDHVQRWYEFGRRGRVDMDWHALLADYVAAVDWPVANYYRELMAAFPDAKVILTVRDPDRWFDSFQVLVRLTAAMRWVALLPKFRRFARMVDTAVWHIFDERTSRAHAIDVFNRHNEEVKKHVPKDRLLVFDVRDGWAPLCEPLGVPAPDIPFPHNNTRGEVQRFTWGRVARDLVRALGWILIAALLAYLILRLVSGDAPAAMDGATRLAALA